MLAAICLHFASSSYKTDRQ